MEGGEVKYQNKFYPLTCTGVKYSSQMDAYSLTQKIELPYAGSKFSGSGGVAAKLRKIIVEHGTATNSADKPDDGEYFNQLIMSSEDAEKESGDDAPIMTYDFTNFTILNEVRITQNTGRSPHIYLPSGVLGKLYLDVPSNNNVYIHTTGGIRNMDLYGVSPHKVRHNLSGTLAENLTFGQGRGGYLLGRNYSSSRMVDSITSRGDDSLYSRLDVATLGKLDFK